MKKIFFLGLLFLTIISSFGQTIGYDAFGLLLSKEDLNGTARYTAMSGAFGALGGNQSAVDVNPAGLAIFKNSEATISLQNINTNLQTNYFNSIASFSNNNLNLSQAGGVMVFENNNAKWSKVAIGVNYSLLNDFDKSYLINGNSSLSEYYIDPYLNFDNDPSNDVYYDNVDNQQILNSTTGTNSKTTFTLGFQYDKTLYYGVSVLFNNVDYFQHINFRESNHDNLNNTLNAELNQNLSIYGDGFGLNFGILAKPNKNFRIGIAYQTPTWYNLTEEFKEDTYITLSNTNADYIDNPQGSIYDYKIKTTSKATGSLAYIFGKQGLISLDYIYKPYNTIKIKPIADFSAENDAIKQDLKATNEIRIGGEYRYKNLSLRAGYRSEDNPIKNIKTKNNGYSLGLGIRLSETTKLDFSYSNTTSKDTYSFLQKNDINLDYDNSKINATFTIGL